MGYLTPPVNDAWKQTLTETAYTPDVSVQLELKNGEAIVFDLDRIAKGFVKGSMEIKLFPHVTLLFQKMMICSLLNLKISELQTLSQTSLRQKHLEVYS